VELLKKGKKRRQTAQGNKSNPGVNSFGELADVSLGQETTLPKIKLEQGAGGHALREKRKGVKGKGKLGLTKVYESRKKPTEKQKH